MAQNSSTTTRSRTYRALFLVSALIVFLAAPLSADPVSLAISTPDFLIPLDGKQGSLTVYSSGQSPTTSGFNSLGSQSFVLSGNSTSTGTLTLNLYFSGYPLGDPSFVVGGATIQFQVHDFDFLPDQVTNKVTLTEVAFLRAVNGDKLDEPIKLADYLPSGTTDTDDETIVLDPIALMPPLSSSDFTNPFILSLRLTASATNTGWAPISLVNTPESLISNVNLTLTPVRPPVALPLPSTLLLFGAGALSILLFRRQY